MFYENIRAFVEANWAELEASKYPEDLIHYWADSEVPVYNSEIYSQWGSLPADAHDEWQSVGFEVSIESTILDLMKVDIYLYLYGLYNRAYSEILATKEGN